MVSIPSFADSIEQREAKNKQLALYLIAVIIGATGAAYAAVPLYRIFCQATGYGGTVQTEKKGVKSLKDTEINEKKMRSIEVEFSGDTRFYNCPPFEAE